MSLLPSRTALSVAVAVSCSLSFPLFSAAPALAATQAADLDRVVVTGTRTALTVDESLAAVEVIDHDAIERSQARSLQELLRGRG